MRTLLLRIGPVLASALLAAAFATSYRALDIEQMAAKADIAFFGTVSEVEVEMQDGKPWTRVSFRVEEALLGDPGETVRLSFYGGRLQGGEGLSVVGMPQFETGEKVLILAYDAQYYSPIVGFSQGLWRLSPQGLRDERGRILSLDDEGTLVQGGKGAGTQDLLAAMKTLLEAAR